MIGYYIMHITVLHDFISRGDLALLDFCGLFKNQDGGGSGKT